MVDQKKTWFCVVDGGKGRLLVCDVVPPGRLHVEEHGRIERPPEDTQHGRPSALTGKSGNTYASEGHEVEEDLHRFARDVAAWMDEEIVRRQIETLNVFSAPRFLGALRKVRGARLASRMLEQQADLAHLSTGALAEHPAIRALVPNIRSAGRPG